MKTNNISCILKRSFLPILAISMFTAFEKNANGDWITDMLDKAKVIDAADAVRLSRTGFIDTSSSILAGNTFSSTGRIRIAGQLVFSRSAAASESFSCYHGLDVDQNMSEPSGVDTPAFSVYPNISKD